MDDDAPPLSAQDLEAYVRDGFVLLKQAFPPSVAHACRQKLWELMQEEGEGAGIVRDDPGTWPVKFPVSMIFEEGHGASWTDVFTPRLQRAVDQLCGGKDSWAPFGCGWWMMTFPSAEKKEWGLDGHWHIDGNTRHRCLHTHEVGLVPIFLFSDVAPQGGGTALCRGSHHFVARLLHDAGPKGIDALDIIQQGKVYASEKMASDPRCVVETVGEAGDVMFTHPFLLHGRSRNCAAVPSSGSEAGVRFMCHPGVKLRRAVDLCVGEGRKMSPTERAIVAGLPQGGGRLFSHKECLAAASKKEEEGRTAGRKRRKEETESSPRPEEEEEVDEDVLAVMGMTGFGSGKRKR